MNFICLFLINLGLFLTPLIASAQTQSFNPVSRERPQRIRAQGTRGCPRELGELELLGAQLLETQSSQPNLVFWVATKHPETILVTVTIPQQIPLVFSRKLTVDGTGYLPIKVEGNLERGVDYRLTAGILCNGSTTNAKALESSLRRVNAPTDFDRLISEYQSPSFVRVNIIHNEP